MLSFFDDSGIAWSTSQEAGVEFHLSTLSGQAAAPLLTRLYAPEEFGVLALFVSLVTVVGLVACLRYELSIPLARSRRDALASLILCLLLTCGIALLVAPVADMLGGTLSGWLQARDLERFLWLLPVAVLHAGLASALAHWAAREESFGAVAWSSVATSLGLQVTPDGGDELFAGYSSSGTLTSSDTRIQRSPASRALFDGARGAITPARALRNHRRRQCVRRGSQSFRSRPSLSEGCQSGCMRREPAAALHDSRRFSQRSGRPGPQGWVRASLPRSRLTLPNSHEIPVELPENLFRR